MPDIKKYSSKLVGKRVLVIGGSSGIGFAVAQAVVEFGATTTIASSNPTKVQKSVDALLKDYPSAEGRISGHACDLGSRDLESNLKKLFAEVGQIDHLVYTAADNLSFMALDDVSLEKVEKLAHLRVFAALLAVKVAKKYLFPGPGSSIILTTGTVGEKPLVGGWTVMSFIASGIYGLTRQLALEIAPVRVNAVSPGLVETELWDSIGKDAFDQVKKGTESTLPTGRVAQPEDIAESYIYLMKDLNITGTVISTNGGSLLV